MSHVAAGSVVRQLGALFEGGSVTGLSDRQLLERYSAGAHEPAGEAAFAALVDRHGPMVLAVCRQFLGDAQHAEDAFQAVFLVLAQKARSLRDPDLLGNWLYGVAVRTARCTRQQMVRRRRREEIDAMNGPGATSCAAAEPTAPPADRPAIDREQAEALHGEVDRLPKAFRLPVVLCYFEGLTLDEAARRLRCPAGTLRSRLARAREKLRIALTRRGVVLPAAALGAVLSPRSASASISPLLCDSTTRAAIAFAARHAAATGGLSAPAATLAQEVLRTMLIHKLRLVVMATLVLAAIVGGAGYLAVSVGAPARPREGTPVAKPARTEPRPTDPARPVPARMTVAGRVLGPDGKPVEGAVVDLIARRRSPRTGTSDEGDDYKVLGQGRSDGEGRFRLDAARTASTRVYEVHALAAAPGYGLGWAELNPDAEQPTAEITLQPEQVARARLVDVTGAPAKDVEVRVGGVGRPSGNGRARYEGTSVGLNPPEGLRTWPKAVRTDDQGRIAVPGIGRGVSVSLEVRDLRYARQGFSIDAAQSDAGKESTIALQPARIIEGRVLAADTGRPIPNAIVAASTLVKSGGVLGISNIRFRADGEGRFVMNPIVQESYTLTAIPSGGEPYLTQEVELKWTKGAVRASQDIKVRRGVLIRGKVTERGTGRPLPESSIQFMPARGGGVITWGSGSIVASGEDGSFQLAVPPGRGHLIVFGPTGDYILGEVGFNKLREDRPGGRRYRAHAIISFDAKAGDPPHEVAAVLRPGVALKARVEGPEGRTVTDGFVLSTLHIALDAPTWTGHQNIPVRDGRFELHGIDPEGSARISILDPEHEWGTTLEVTGKQAAEDPTIRLQPCGRAAARFVGPDGKPLAGHSPMFEFVATPGPSQYSETARDQAELTADAELVVNVDREHYGSLPATDAEGRITLPSLIPGALYRISDFSTANDPNKGVAIRKEFTVKPDETLDLGDILIEKPEAR